MSMEFERSVRVTGDLIESFLSMLARHPSGTGGFDDFPIDGPAGREEEIFQLVNQRIQKSYPWVALALTPEAKIRCSGITP
ncbi:hypothetical protein [Pseudomonas chlororaphis]|uniref:hypothetical protein n=1 Tax=Pseudomonas chlororaphis TaxID=587753 RepID=UPI001267D15E|nr:hypothetical protein [Pseudomonas chlororaphis]QQX60938.1 hypothetical protein JHW28_10460 [Pseudomonas chlororaphis subsp. aurantiaca]